MSKKEFSEFKNCEMSTAEIENEIQKFGEDWQNDFLKYLYSLLFFTNIQIKNKVNLQKIIGAYLGYKEGNFVTIDEKIF